MDRFLLQKVPNDDICDRLSYSITPSLLLFFASCITLKQNLGSPIVCKVPNEWRSGWEKFAETFCYINGTYYVDANEKIPTEKPYIGYYQYIPLSLVVMTGVFCAPGLIWNYFSEKKPEQLICYFVMKVAYTSIPITVFLVLSHYFQTYYWPSFHFPTLTLCDVPFRHLGREYEVSETIQCVLPINFIVRETILFFWLWLIVLFILNLLSLLYWLGEHNFFFLFFRKVSIVYLKLYGKNPLL